MHHVIPPVRVKCPWSLFVQYQKLKQQTLVPKPSNIFVGSLVICLSQTLDLPAKSSMTVKP
eukprot:12916598-Ditylum_brightwellii.AAC.1